MYRKRAVNGEDDSSSRQEKRPRSGVNDLSDVLNARFLANDRRERPAGLIFMCSSLTKRDCFHYKVFGLPLAKRDVVERVTPGMRLFLFDFDSRELHGIYEAASHGGMNLEPNAFQDSKGSYPAQVRFDVRTECMPLSEDIFREAIKENYYAQNKFDSELSSDQVLKLIQLFRGREWPQKATDSLDMVGSLRQGDPLGIGLLGRSVHLLDPLELSHGASKYGLPFQASRGEERIQGYASLPGHLAQIVDERIPRLLQQQDLERLGHHPHNIDVVDNARLLQILPPQVGHLSRATGLLDKVGMEEADQLALKYLQQANPVVDNSGLLSVDHFSRQHLIPQGEHATPWIGNVLASHWVPGSEGAAMGNVSLMTRFPVSNDLAIRNLSALQAGLVNGSSALPIIGPNNSALNIGILPSAAALGRHIGAGDLLRQQIGRGAVRRA